MLKHFLIAIMLFTSTLLYSQSQYNFICGTTSGNPPNTPVGVGLAKPMKTPPTNDETKYFRVLMVFVEFLDDEEGSDYYWPDGGLPTYSNQLFASTKQLGLTAYESYKISDYFNKVSRDEFDVIADIKWVELTHEYEYYSSITQAQTEVFSLLDNQIGIDWDRYDLWRWNEDEQQYEQFDDGYIDMIYVQYRRVDPFGITWGGEGSTIVNYTTSTGKYINNSSISYIGSGVTGYDGWQLPLSSVVGLFRHEYCHYSLGNHKPYSTVAGQDGTNTVLGYELGMSPMDMIAVGYGNIINFTGSETTYSIGDLHSTGTIIQIPTETTYEYFLISNRRRIVGDGSGLIYDCNMAGDTAQGAPFLQFKDYSKGLYIYHVTDMNNFDFWADLECADGLWNWQEAGTSTPDWSSEQTLPILSKVTAGYNEDNPTTAYYYDLSRLESRDGHSVVSQSGNPYSNWGVKWLGIGKRHTCLNGGQECNKGIDRIYTNLEEVWTSREWQGDRWDAWAIDYNQIFSPYSSPNTNDRNNDPTGIFVFYESLDGNTASIKIYRVSAGGISEDEILQATPPAKPMLYKYDMVECNDGYAHPQIVWENNKEPDMLRDGGFKRYKIYRAITSYPQISVPHNYNYLTTYDDYTPNDTASYIDRDRTYLQCGGIPHTPRDFFRYKVVAVDKYDWESVKSDFLHVSGVLGIPNRPLLIENSPTVFSLSQNYPNPFNPSTEIRFNLAYNTSVSLKIYNVLGEEVAVLVNEYKAKGNYTVVFDGTNLPSGVYFYRIEAGPFAESKKMLMIK